MVPEVQTYLMSAPKGLLKFFSIQMLTVEGKSLLRNGIVYGKLSGFASLLAQASANSNSNLKK